MKCFTGVLLAGMVLITHREERPSEEKILKDVQIQTGTRLVYFTLATAVEIVQDFFMLTIFTCFDILGLTEECGTLHLLGSLKFA